MAVQVKMPKLGMSEADLQLVEWLKKEGEKVNKGDAIAQVEGEKITNEIEASISGVVLKILVEEGSVVKIGTVLAIIGEANEDISGLIPTGAAATGETAEVEETSKIDGVTGDLEDGEIKASPVARKLARKHNINLADILAELQTKKRIQEEDVLAYLDIMKEKEQASGKPKYKEIKLVGMRRTIADRMAKSSHDTAPVVLMRSVDITKFWQLREDKKAEYKDKGVKVPTFNDLIIKAIALALEEHPKVNATFEDGKVRLYEDININLAVAIDSGLVTPVIKNANKLTVWEISKQAKILSDKAKAGTLVIEDMQDGTLTLTNLGMLDIEVSTPIINPPQVAIIAVGTVQPYLVLEEGQVCQHYKTFFSITLDHRVVDGYPGAQYLYTLASILQSPEQLWA